MEALWSKPASVHSVKSKELSVVDVIQVLL